MTRLALLLTMSVVAIVGCDADGDESAVAGIPGFAGAFGEGDASGSCPPSSDPVCGRDDVTYQSACLAVESGTAVAYPWTCGGVLPAHLEDGAPCVGTTEHRSYCFDADCIDGAWEHLPWKCDGAIPRAPTAPPFDAGAFPTPDASASDAGDDAATDAHAGMDAPSAGDARDAGHDRPTDAGDAGHDGRTDGATNVQIDASGDATPDSG